jgi:hypothetical protein
MCAEGRGECTEAEAGRCGGSSEEAGRDDGRGAGKGVVSFLSHAALRAILWDVHPILAMVCETSTEAARLHPV